MTAIAEQVRMHNDRVRNACMLHWTGGTIVSQRNAERGRYEMLVVDGLEHVYAFYSRCSLYVISIRYSEMFIKNSQWVADVHTNIQSIFLIACNYKFVVWLSQCKEIIGWLV